MDTQTSLAILSKVREKRASYGFAEAVNDTANQQLKSDAVARVGRLALAALGIGAAARGGAGLYNQVRRNVKPPRVSANPALMSLPYPVESIEDEEDGPVKKAGFLSGDSASTASGIPWFYPAATMAAIGGGTLGWKGVDSVLNARRKKERQQEMESARQEFHDALLSQYDKPIKSAPKAAPAKSASDKESSDTAGDLDRLFDFWTEKRASLSDMAGQLAGGYGIYAGLTGLGTGALVYDRAVKRQRRAVLEKAMKRRERRRFNMAPPEIMAIPEPIEHQMLPDEGVPKLGRDYFVGMHRR